MLILFCFQTFHRKNNGSVILKSLNPEGPFKRYLCDITHPTLLIMCQFLFYGLESKQRIFLPGERNLFFLSFLWLNLLILTFVCSSVIPSTHDVIIFLKSIFNFLLLLKFCPCHEFSQLVMKIGRDDCGHIKARWDNHHNCLKCSSCSRLSTCSICSTWSEEIWTLADKCRTKESQ